MGRETAVCQDCLNGWMRLDVDEKMDVLWDRSIHGCSTAFQWILLMDRLMYAVGWKDGWTDGVQKNSLEVLHDFNSKTRVRRRKLINVAHLHTPLMSCSYNQWCSSTHSIDFFFPSRLLFLFFQYLSSSSLATFILTCSKWKQREIEQASCSLACRLLPFVGSWLLASRWEMRFHRFQADINIICMTISILTMCF